MTDPNPHDMVPTREQPTVVLQARRRDSVVSERRVRRLRPYAAMFLITLGLAVWGVELIRYWMIAHYAISGAVIGIGSVIAFVGFYLLNHEDAKDAGTFVVDSTIKFIGAIRGGRRSTDNAAVSVETKVEKKDD